MQHRPAAFSKILIEGFSFHKLEPGIPWIANPTCRPAASYTTYTNTPEALTLLSWELLHTRATNSHHGAYTLHQEVEEQSEGED